MSSNAWSRQKRRESLFQRIEGREKGGEWKPLTRVRCTNTNPVKFLFTDRPIWQNEFTLHKNFTPFIIQGLKSTLLPDLIRNFDRSKNFAKMSHLFNLILASKIKNYEEKLKLKEIHEKYVWKFETTGTDDRRSHKDHFSRDTTLR